MKGARALVSGMLILAAVCALPAVSVAQDSGSAPATTTTTSEPPAAPDPPTTTAPAEQPSAPAGDGVKGGGGGAGDGTQNQTGDSSPSAPSATTSVQSQARARSSSTTTVSMEDFFFSPASVTVHVGDLVTWRNTGKEPHTATADDGSFDTGTVTAGSSASHMFTQAGTFTYICTIHPNMKGTVRVLSSSGGGGGGAGGGSAGSSSSGSSQSESSAVNSPDAAGDANTLPMTGLAAGAMALVGLGLLVTGLIVRLPARRSAAAGAGRQLSLF